MKGSYRVGIKASAEKELRRIPAKDLRKIVGKIRGLSGDPRPTGCRKLAGENRFRLRHGDWRIVYEVDDIGGLVTIYKVGHRSEVYR